jgi:hypothetical protein
MLRERKLPADIAVRVPLGEWREEGELAGPTGLEPATSGVTGRRSNQLNYDPTSLVEILKPPLSGSHSRPDRK